MAGLSKLESIKDTENTIEMIDFRLINPLKQAGRQEQLFGINVYKVKEVIFNPENISRIPTSNDFLEGMINLRGHIIPIINLRKRLGYSDSDSRANYLIVTAFNDITCGFMVDEIKKICRISWSNIVSPPDEIRSEFGDLVTSITLLENKDIMLILDFEKIIGDMNLTYTDSLTETTPGLMKVDKPTTLLCVDDSGIARQMARKVLESAGFTVIEAVNGVEGLNILKELSQKASADNRSITDEISIVISDIEMPLMDGFTFTRRIKEEPSLRDLPVILHSSLSRAIIQDRGSDVGATDFLTKFNATSLLESIQKIL